MKTEHDTLRTAENVYGMPNMNTGRDAFGTAKN
jgi:hypothetical protein